MRRGWVGPVSSESPKLDIESRWTWESDRRCDALQQVILNPPFSGSEQHTIASRSNLVRASES